MFIDMTDQLEVTCARLKTYLKTVPEHMRALPETTLLHKPSSIKWSKKEIFGHLIDSALHNWERFAKAQFQQLPFVVRRYEQVLLVDVNGYQNLPLEHLISLWTAMNQQILFIIEQLPPGVENTELAQNNAAGDQEMPTLGWL
ncbi:MAG: DinB family protein, partial [Bacteroidota bacterium]